MVDDARATWRETLECGSTKATTEEVSDAGDEPGRQEEAEGGGGG